MFLDFLYRFPLFLCCFPSFFHQKPPQIRPKQSRTPPKISLQNSPKKSPRRLLSDLRVCERRKKLVRAGRNKFKPLHHKGFGNFWQEKTLWCNVFNSFLPETKENPPKPPKALFFVVFPYVFCYFLLFFQFFSSAHIIFPSILEEAPSNYPVTRYSIDKRPISKKQSMRVPRVAYSMWGLLLNTGAKKKGGNF